MFFRIQIFFIWFRCLFSNLGGGHWLVELRNNLNHTLAFAFEWHLFAVMSKATEKELQLLPAERLTRSRKRTRWDGVLRKQVLLQKARMTAGSRETLFRAHGTRHGLSGSVRGIKLGEYMSLLPGAWDSCRSLRAHWDGANYGDHTLNLMIALNVNCRTGSHVKPMVPHQKLLESPVWLNMLGLKS